MCRPLLSLIWVQYASEKNLPKYKMICIRLEDWEERFHVPFCEAAVAYLQ